MSVILCSLLLGVGYNAYVVVGYAPQARTGVWACLPLSPQGYGNEFWDGLTSRWLDDWGADVRHRHFCHCSVSATYCGSSLNGAAHFGTRTCGMVLVWP